MDLKNAMAAVKIGNPQKQTTLPSCSSSSIARREWADQPTPITIMAALNEIQRAKGKWYSEVMMKFYSTNVPERTKEHLDGLVATIQAQKVNTADLLTVTRRIRITEFSGTTYMPLPDEAAIVRIIREVQGESIIQRSNEPRKGYDPDPIDMSEYDGMTEDETWEAMFEKAYQKCGGR